MLREAAASAGVSSAIRMHTPSETPPILLEMALRQGAGALRDILRLVGGSADEERPLARRGARPRRPRAARPRPSRPRRRGPAAPRRARARRGPAGRPGSPLARLRPRAGAGDEPAHVSREAEPVASFGPADDPSPTIEVQAPWAGYDAQPAAEVIKRVRAADEATQAVVLLYERGHKGRASVIRAAGGPSAAATCAGGAGAHALAARADERGDGRDHRPTALLPRPSARPGPGRRTATCS